MNDSWIKHLYESQEAAYEFLTGIFVETESIAVQMDQSTRSVDNALSFIEELFQNLFMMAKNFTV